MLGLKNLLMIKNCPKFYKNIFYNKAFTLSELLITLVVVGILAAIILPIIHAIVPDQNSLMAKRAFAVTQTAIAEIINNNDCYPERYDRLGIDDGYRYSRCSQWSGSSATEGDAAAKFITLFQSNLDVKTGASIYNGMSSATITTKDGLVYTFKHLDELREPHKKVKNAYITVSVDTNGDKRPNCGQSDVFHRCTSSVTKGFDTFTMRIYQQGKIIIEDCWAVDSIKVDKKLTGTIDTLGTCVSIPIESSATPDAPSPSCPESYIPTGPEDVCCKNSNFAGKGKCDVCYNPRVSNATSECCQNWFEDSATYGDIKDESIINACCAAGVGSFCNPCYNVFVSGPNLGYCCQKWYRSGTSSPDYDSYSFSGIDIDELNTACCGAGYNPVCSPKESGTTDACSVSMSNVSSECCSQWSDEDINGEIQYECCSNYGKHCKYCDYSYGIREASRSVGYFDCRDGNNPKLVFEDICPTGEASCQETKGQKRECDGASHGYHYYETNTTIYNSSHNKICGKYPSGKEGDTWAGYNQFCGQHNAHMASVDELKNLGNKIFSELASGKNPSFSFDPSRSSYPGYSGNKIFFMTSTDVSATKVKVLELVVDGPWDKTGSYHWGNTYTVDKAISPLVHSTYGGDMCIFNHIDDRINIGGTDYMYYNVCVEQNGNVARSNNNFRCYKDGYK